MDKIWRLILRIYVIILITYAGFSQMKKNEGTRFGNFQAKIESVAETSVFISFKADTTNYALFLSTSGECLTKGELLTFKNELGADTIDYPLLKLYPRIGKFIASSVPKEGKICIKNLATRNDYWLLIYKVMKDSLEYVAKTSFSTIAQKPEYQALNLAFDDVTDSSFVVSWVNGSGEGRILVLAEGERLETPENGKDYGSSSVFGKGGIIGNKCFVVYDGKEPRPKVKVTGLEPSTKYTIAVFEYNGEGKYRHYNLAKESNNPRVLTTRLSPPKISSIEKVDENVYEIRWQESKGATSYILDVAKDKDFKQFVEPYQELDIGDLQKYEISDLVPNEKYFIRMKAKGPNGESAYSPTFELKTK
ncbi:MAG: fibronectin type III domain-containing protein [Candidatus Kapaibacteriota bacterium]